MQLLLLFACAWTRSKSHKDSLLLSRRITDYCYAATAQADNNNIYSRSINNVSGLLLDIDRNRTALVDIEDVMAHAVERLSSNGILSYCDMRNAHCTNDIGYKHRPTHKFHSVEPRCIDFLYCVCTRKDTKVPASSASVACGRKWALLCIS